MTPKMQDEESPSPPSLRRMTKVGAPTESESDSDQGLLGALPRYNSRSPFQNDISVQSSADEDSIFLPPRMNTPSPSHIIKKNRLSPQSTPSSPQKSVMSGRTIRQSNNSFLLRQSLETHAPEILPNYPIPTPTLTDAVHPHHSPRENNSNRGRSRSRKRSEGKRKQYRRPDSNISRHSNTILPLAKKLSQHYPSWNLSSNNKESPTSAMGAMDSLWECYSEPNYWQTREPNHTDSSQDERESVHAVPLNLQSMSLSSPSYTLPQDALIRLKGGVTEPYSSHILVYASPVLANHLTPQVGGFFQVDLSNGEPEEWKALKPFLQPHSVQKAAVNVQNLAILLPWFHELELDILLKECDHILSSLRLTSNEPTNQDWSDILLLAQICTLVELPSTCTTCFDFLQCYLSIYPSILCTDKSKLDGVVELIRESEQARRVLWEYVAFDLPSDLLEDDNDLDDSIAEDIVKNTLFPFLWREGLRKREALKQEQEIRDREKQQIAQWRQHKKMLQEVGVELNDDPQEISTLAQDSQEAVDKTVQDDNLVFDLERLEEDEDVQGNPSATTTHSTASRPSAEEFSTWWHSWSSSTPAPAPKEDKDRCCHEHSFCGGDNTDGALPVEVVPSRTAWLQQILDNLKRPSLFGTYDAPLSGQEDGHHARQLSSHSLESSIKGDRYHSDGIRLLV